MLILGGSGRAGGFIASALLRRAGGSVVLGARSGGPLERAAGDLVAKYGAERINTAIVDASDPAGLARAMEGIGIAVLATHAEDYRLDVARAAIAAGVDLVDLMPGSAELEPLRLQATDAGRCFVTDVGLSPGLPAVLMRLAGERLGDVQTAFVGGSVSNPEGWPADTLEEVIGEIADLEPLLFRNGQWQRRPFAGALDARVFDLGPDRGRRRCSLFFAEELRAIPDLLPSLREAGSFLSVNRFVDQVALPVSFLLVKVAPRRGRRPAARLFGWGMRRFARPPFGAAMVLEATGSIGGGPATALRIVLTHRNEYEATGEVVATYISHWADPASGARRPGVHIMGHIVDPESFLHDLADRDFDIA